MKPQDIELLHTLGAPAVNPRSGRVVVAVRNPDLDSDGYLDRLWGATISTQNDSTYSDDALSTWERVTDGDGDSSPLFSPDGRWLVFTRKVEGKPQLALIPAGGGEVRVLTDFPAGVEGPAWFDEDGSHIVTTARIPEAGRSVEGKPSAQPPRLITHDSYRLDGRGFTHDQVAQIVVIAISASSDVTNESAENRGSEDSAPSISSRILTAGSTDYRDPQWTRWGILALRNRQDALLADLVLLRPDEDGTLIEVELQTGTSGVSGAMVSGDLLYFLGFDYGPDHMDFIGRSAAMYSSRLAEYIGEVETGWTDAVALADAARSSTIPAPTIPAPAGPADTSPTARVEVRSAEENPKTREGHSGSSQTVETQNAQTVEPANVASVESAGAQAGEVQADATLQVQRSELLAVTRLNDPTGERLLGFLSTSSSEVGQIDLLREVRGTVELVTWTGSEFTTVLCGPYEAQGAAQLADGSRIVTVKSSSDPGEVYRVQPGGLQRISDFNVELRRAAPALPLTEIQAVASDGYPVHGWVALPEGKGPHPVVLLIHGGPHSFYGPAFFDEVQVLAGAGYAVVFGNPRGSSGYGQEHGRAITGGFGDRDSADVQALLASALATYTNLDEDRIGVMGGSYGGYLTAWLTSHSSQWRGAIVERALLDPVSFAGSSDIGWYFGWRYLGEDPDRVRTQSPMARINQVCTPTFVIHSEHDWRCPVEQGQRWYAGLRRRGIETQLLLFPGEGHELTRSGTPRHRLTRFDHVLRWWERHLSVGA